MRLLKKGRLYDVPGRGVCQCILVNPMRARLRPQVKHDVSFGTRRFRARGKAFDVSPSAVFREVES